jgi:hypothetical protein
MQYLALLELGEVLDAGGDPPVDEPFLEGALPLVACCGLNSPVLPVFLF